MKKSILSVLFILASLAAFGQTSIKVQAPNLVAVDETFNVMFVIEGEHSPSEFTWSEGDDFQLVWGPQKGKSSSVSIINGKKTSSTQVTYTYVLMPRKAGTFQLPAAEAVIKGETIRSRQVTIQVAPDQSQKSAAQSSSGNSEELSTGTVPSGDLFLKMSLSKTKVVLGESITASLKLYQRTNITGIDDAKFPSFNGFWSQELQAPQNIEFKREAIGDRIYNAALLRSWTLIPQQTGDIRIDPAELVCTVTVRAPGSSSGSVFDSFFQDDYRTIRKRVITDAFTVHVSALPSGAPESFGGGVGNFEMSVSLTKDSLKTHDAASLNVVITGKGNVSLLDAPKINFPPDFELYDVKTTEGAGSKSFEFPFIPRSHGEFTLGPVEYSYYDVSKGRYVTLRSNEMKISVARGSEDSSYAGQTVAAPVGKKDVRNLGNDIRFIETSTPSFHRQGRVFAGSGLFWLLAALIILAAAASFFLFRGMAARRADVAGTKSRSATKMARKRLSSAGEYLAKDLCSAFYEELHKALLGFVSDKLNMDMADMSRENIARELAESGVGESLCTEFVELLDACEYARYAPATDHAAMSEHYEKAVSAISMIDDRMRNRNKKSFAGISALLLLLAPFGSYAAQQESPDSLWNAGIQAYSTGMWQEAFDEWNGIVAAGMESPELYYNMGNACFKLQDYAHAILFYERALKLNPSYSDAKYNLEYLNSIIQDKVEPVPEFFVKAGLRKVSYLMPSGYWAVLSLAMLLAAAVMLLLFLLSASKGRRKTGFFLAIAFAVLALLSLGFGLSQRKTILDTGEAIIVSPVSSVKSSPGVSATDLFVLHEGTKVKVVDTVSGWAEIQLADGRQGWIQSGDKEDI